MFRLEVENHLREIAPVDGWKCFEDTGRRTYTVSFNVPTFVGRAIWNLQSLRWKLIAKFSR
jgi:hypothetical protein